MNEESPAPDWFLTLIHLIALVTIVSYALTTYVIIKAGSAGGTRVNRCLLIVVVTVLTLFIVILTSGVAPILFPFYGCFYSSGWLSFIGIPLEVQVVVVKGLGFMTMISFNNLAMYRIIQSHPVQRLAAWRRIVIRSFYPVIWILLLVEYTVSVVFTAIRAKSSWTILTSKQILYVSHKINISSEIFLNPRVYAEAMNQYYVTFSLPLWFSLYMIASPTLMGVLVVARARKLSTVFVMATPGQRLEQVLFRQLLRMILAFDALFAIPVVELFVVFAVELLPHYFQAIGMGYLVWFSLTPIGVMFTVVTVHPDYCSVLRCGKSSSASRKKAPRIRDNVNPGPIH